jgi:hypothetical protein
VTGSLSVVPEPSAFAIALAGLACGGFSMWRRKRALRLLNPHLSPEVFRA